MSRQCKVMMLNLALECTFADFVFFKNQMEHTFLLFFFFVVQFWILVLIYDLNQGWVIR